MKRAMRVLAGVLVALVVAGGSLLCIGEKGIPFVEGDKITRNGEAEGFRIGMTREEAFTALKAHYRGADANIRFLWKRDTDPERALAAFEHPQSRTWVSNPYAYYEGPVDTLTTIPKPLEVGGRWDVRLPGT